MENTKSCQAITNGDKITFDDLSNFAPDGVTWTVDGERCKLAASYAVDDSDGTERCACRKHLADLVDGAAGDWTGNLVALRLMD